MAEEPPPQPPRSISARIAALQLDQVGRSPGETPQPQQSGLQARPPPPSRPAAESRRNTANVPPLRANGTTAARSIGNQPVAARSNGVLPPPAISRTSSSDTSTPRPSPPPRLPARKGSGPAPGLPPRRQSEHQGARRGSNDSTSSAVSNVSSISAFSAGTGVTSLGKSPVSEGASRIKAPAYDPSTLPVLPPKRSDTGLKKLSKHSPGSESTPSKHMPAPAVTHQPQPTPALPPRLPTRHTDGGVTARRTPELPPSVPTRSALSFGLNMRTDEAPAMQPRHPSVPADGEAAPAPPPIPFASRPTAAQLQASRPPPATRGTAESCLRCRDFSAPDAHAARFPRQSVPSGSLDWLAQQLTSPFPSATDKARVIFTWLHHNVEYDTASFFGGTVRPSTPQSTLKSGLAVCEGYAGLFCTLATKAGLECMVVGGHGKGYGITAPAPGAPLPPYGSNHAWNAVKLDEGAWKLIDPCWGAGAVNGPDVPYLKRFEPTHFTKSNIEFGKTHFPDDRRSFFREDGRAPSWEEYIGGDEAAGDPVTVFTSASGEHGLSESSFQPRRRTLAASTSPTTVRFQFAKVCPHWDNAVHGAGAPYAFTLSTRGGSDHIPFETDADHSIWWCDVPARDLGHAGDALVVNSVTQVDGRDARGLTAQGFRDARGKKSMAWMGVAAWALV
ncbi:MAG: hypothetical protein M1832_000946 [Thelocarpon impressellum]|nr:MAG: hypothetical protein M1832_000946 [Thelocarpon impressellum]